MLMVHQPAVEISIGDIFKTNQYERENRHAAMIYVICRLTWVLPLILIRHIDIAAAIGPTIVQAKMKKIP